MCFLCLSYKCALKEKLLSNVSQCAEAWGVRFKHEIKKSGQDHVLHIALHVCWKGFEAMQGGGGVQWVGTKVLGFRLNSGVQGLKKGWRGEEESGRKERGKWGWGAGAGGKKNGKREQGARGLGSGGSSGGGYMLGGRRFRANTFFSGCSTGQPARLCPCWPQFEHTLGRSVMVLLSCSRRLALHACF